MKSTYIKKLNRLLAIAVAFLVAAPAYASDWPDRAVRFVVPYAAGNQADIVARLVAEKLSEEFEQTFVVENVPGAGGSIGVGRVAKSKPDGYTLGLSAIAALALVPHIQPVNYDPNKDLSLLAAVTELRVFGLAVGSTVPATNIDELVAYSKSHNDKPLTYSTAGVGTIFHLDMEMISSALGEDFMHIPFRGSGSSVSNAIGGQVDMVFEGISQLSPQADAGRLKIIAVTDSSRPSSPAGVKSFAEQGVQADVKTAWQAIVAPVGVSPEILEKLEIAIMRIVASDDFKKKLPVGTEPLELDGKAARERMSSESELFNKMVLQLGLQRQ